MLQAIRSRASGIIAKALFVLLIASFAAWGITDFTSGPGPSETVATVGDREIGVAELRTAVRTRLRPVEGQLTELQARQIGIVDQVLEQLIDGVVIDVAATAIGLDASDSQVVSAIRQQPVFAGPGGGFDEYTFQQVLAAIGMSESDYVERVRGGVRAGMLIGSIAAGGHVPDVLTDTLAAYRQERRRADLAVVPHDKFTDLGEPPDEALAELYDANADLYRSPERRVARVIHIDRATVAAEIPITDAALRQAYDDRVADFTTPERRTVNQIVGAEVDIRTVAAALSEGRAFDAAVASVPGQATIELGALSRDEMLPEVADMVFALDVGETSEPVESPLGWHIFQVTDIAPGGIQPLAMISEQLRSELQRERAVDRLADLSNQLEDLLAGGASLDEASTAIGHPVRTLPPIDANGFDASDNAVTDLPAADTIAALFETDAGQQSLLRDADDGGAYVVSVESVLPPEPLPLAAVRDDLETAWREEAQATAAEQLAVMIQSAVRDGTPLTEVAEREGLTVVTPEPFNRDEAAPDDGLSRAMVAKLFSAAVGDVVRAPTDDGIAVAHLAEIVPASLADPTSLNRIRSDLRDEIREGLSGDLLIQLRQSVRDRVGVDIEQATIDDIYPPDAGY